MTNIEKQLLNSPKIRQLFHTHCVEGTRTHITLGGKQFSADELAQHYGVKLSKSNKYKVEKEHADMEGQESTGSAEKHGDGDSQSTE